MEEVQVITIEIGGQEYFLVDYVTSENNTYDFFVNINNKDDIQLLKEQVENEEKFYVSIDNEKEFDKAFELYYDKLKKETNEI